MLIITKKTNNSTCFSWLLKSGVKRNKSARLFGDWGRQHLVTRRYRKLEAPENKKLRNIMGSNKSAISVHLRY